jgi:predicted dehydrogenase/nucleoside-diphosphate-sugar epimerase
MQFASAPRLAIIGCGAVAEQRHAPALKDLGWKPTALIDVSAARRRAVAELLNSAPVEAEEIVAALPAFDAAIVSVPHFLHEQVCVELLRAGKHVLVEKPMALTKAACRAMNLAAAESGARLGVAFFRRQWPAGRWLKEALDADAFGKIRRFTIREGYNFNWPLTTDSMWRKEQAGGGVLADTGAHTMDQIIWWFGEPDEVEYFDDNEGGVEANALVRLRWGGGLEGEIELTRTWTVENELTLETEKGALALSMSGNRLLAADGMLAFKSTVVKKPPFAQATWFEMFRQQLIQFRSYIDGRPAHIVTGDEGARSVALIERCYERRRTLNLPWRSLPVQTANGEVQKPTLGNIAGDLERAEVLVTGGTGFIGARLVERLLAECRARPRVLLRDYSRAASIARFGLDQVKLVRGDLADRITLNRAVQGCSIVFHCAMDREDRASNIAGIRSLIDACVEHKARLVHVSTFAIYEPLTDGDLTEDMEPIRSGIPYSEMKLDVEEAVLDAVRTCGLDASIILPTIVYGPYGKSWTVFPAAQITAGSFVLPREGEGLCNAVHVDDVCQAMIRAAVAPAARGRRYLISGSEPVTWRAFYESIAEALERPGPLLLSDVGLKELNTNRVHAVKQLLANPRRLMEWAPVRSFARYAKLVLGQRARAKLKAL